MVQRTPNSDQQTHDSTNRDVMSFAVETDDQALQWDTSGSVGYAADGLATARRSTTDGEFANDKGRVDLSIVTSMYRSASFLERFYERTCKVASQISPNFEIIFVNDGSPDNSLEVALKLQELDPRVIVVDLSRNFGEHKATITGLRQSRGDYVFRIHCDLDEPPEVLHFFYQDMKRLGVDTVYGLQEQREGHFVKRFLGACFYTFYNTLATTKIRKNPLACRLMTRRYVDALLEYREQQVFMAGLFEIVGFEQHGVTVVKKEHDTSTYTLGKRLAMTMKAVTSFSDKPLLAIPIVGAIVSGLAVLSAIAGGIIQISGLLPVPGWFWVIASIWGGTGLILSCLGIISIYMITVLAEVKDRPYTTVRHVYKRQTQG